MYFTHHFAHEETLSRARSWLTRLGFSPHEIQTHTQGSPRLSLSVNAQRLPEVRFLINALERSDPDSFASFWEEAKKTHPCQSVAEEVDAAEPCVRPHAGTIGWHPPDWSLMPESELRALREWMSR